MLKEARLGAPSRMLCGLIQLMLVLGAGVAITVWVERNCALPIIPVSLGWPWIVGFTWPVTLRAVWNAGLIVAGISLAQGLAGRLARHSVPQMQRTLELASGGVSAWAVMGLWQATGIVVWAPSLPLVIRPWAIAVGIVIYWLCLAGFLARWLRGMVRGRLAPSLGLLQIYTGRDSARALNQAYPGQSLWVRRARPELMAWLAAAIFITPIMSLDRLIVGLVLVSSLRFVPKWEM